MGLEPTPLFQCMTFALMHAGVENDEEMHFEVSSCGELMRVKLLNSTGDVVMCAIGNSYDDLGEQFALEGELRSAPCTSQDTASGAADRLEEG